MLEKISEFDIKDNVFELLRHQACVVNFGDFADHNGLSIGWALMGSLWRMTVTSVFVKPTRYSFKYSENSKYFSLIWFDDDIHQKMIKFFGENSGRDMNKDLNSGLHSIELDHCCGYEEARLIITCEKIYSHSIKEEEILDQNVINLPLYQDKLFHSEYIGKIVGVYVKK